jgi:hypothetical protein
MEGTQKSSGILQDVEKALAFATDNNAELTEIRVTDDKKDIVFTFSKYFVDLELIDDLKETFKSSFIAIDCKEFKGYKLSIQVWVEL